MSGKVRVGLVQLALMALVALQGAAGAQDEESKSPVNRRDLAQSYLRLDEAVIGADLAPGPRANANKAFDQATLAFFGGKLGEAVRQIDAATLDVIGQADNAAMAQAMSVRGSGVPNPYIQSSDAAPAIELQPLYELAGTEKRSLHRVVLRYGSGDGTAVSPEGEAVTLDTDQAVTLPVPGAKTMRPGRYSIEVETAGGNAVVVGYWNIVTESPSALAERYQEKLDALDVQTPALLQARAAVRARAGLLTDNPSPDNNAEMLADPAILSNVVASEVAALEGGANPFEKRRGDYWRVFETDSGETIPLRVYFPAEAPNERPVPLVVAFHGAGGDENMFMNAYGAGRIKALADEREFLLVSPLTYAFNAGAGPRFEALLDMLKRDYLIDEEQIYVLGHSMGGGVTSAIIQAHPDLVTAASPICGFRKLPDGVTGLPPTYVVAAEFDPLAQPDQVEEAAKAAQEAGLPVEYKLMKGYGHTLVVGDVLPNVIAWLFDQP